MDSGPSDLLSRKSLFKMITVFSCQDSRGSFDMVVVSSKLSRQSLAKAISCQGNLLSESFPCKGNLLSRWWLLSLCPHVRGRGPTHGQVCLPRSSLVWPPVAAPAPVTQSPVSQSRLIFPAPAPVTISRNPPTGER